MLSLEVVKVQVESISDMRGSYQISKMDMYYSMNQNPGNPVHISCWHFEKTLVVKPKDKGVALWERPV